MLRPVMAGQENRYVALAEGLDDLLLELHERHLGEDALLHHLHSPAPGEEGLHLSMAAVVVAPALEDRLRRVTDELRVGLPVGAKQEERAPRRRDPLGVLAERADP